MADPIGTLAVRITGDTSRLSSDVSRGVASAGASALRTAAKFAGPLIAAYGVKKAVDGIKAATKSASDLGEAVNATEVVYKEFGKNASKEVAKLSAASARTYGLSQKDFRGMAVQFSSFVSTVAGKGGDVVGTLDDLTGRAADFASVMNLEVADAARIFQSGLAGETEPLKKYGINLSAAAVESYALAEGIATSGEEMSEAEKIQARYGLLMKATANTTGDFANTSDSLANKQRILGASWENLKATLGTVFIPAAEAATGAVANLVEKIDRIANNKRVQRAIGEVGTALKDAFGPALNVSGLDKITSKQVAQWFERLADTIPTVAAFIRDDFLPSFSSLADTAKDLATGTASGTWTLLSSLGDALASMPPEWRDDIVKIGALLAIVSKIKPVGSIFSGVGNLFGKQGILAGTKTMAVTAGIVNVNGGVGGGKPGAVPVGKVSKPASVARNVARTAARTVPVAVGAAAVAAALTAGSVSLVRALDPKADEKGRAAQKASIKTQIDAVINFERGKVSNDNLTRWIANNVRQVGGEASVPNILQTIIAQADTAKANKELSKTVADRVAKIAADANTLLANKELDETSALRIAEMLAAGDVAGAERLLNQTARDRDQDTTAIGRTAVAESVLNKTARDRDSGVNAHLKNNTVQSELAKQKYVVDVAVRIRQGAVGSGAAPTGGAISRSEAEASIGGGKMFPYSPRVTVPYESHGYAVDLGTPEGTPIYAPWSGTLSNRSYYDPTTGFYSYGRLAAVSGAGGTVRVAHLSRFATSGPIAKGQIMGWTGNVGKSSGPHAHLELIRNGQFVNPVGLYDKGGLLAHGGMALNLSGREERVLNPEQTRALATLQLSAAAPVSQTTTQVWSPTFVAPQQELVASVSAELARHQQATRRWED